MATEISPKDVYDWAKYLCEEEYNKNYAPYCSKVEEIRNLSEEWGNGWKQSKETLSQLEGQDLTQFKEKVHQELSEKVDVYIKYRTIRSDLERIQRVYAWAINTHQTSGLSPYKFREMQLANDLEDLHLQKEKIDQLYKDIQDAIWLLRRAAEPQAKYFESPLAIANWVYANGHTPNFTKAVKAQLKAQEACNAIDSLSPKPEEHKEAALQNNGSGGPPASPSNTSVKPPPPKEPPPGISPQTVTPQKKTA